MEIQGNIYIFCRFFFICKTKYLLEFQIFEINNQGSKKLENSLH